MTPRDQARAVALAVAVLDAYARHGDTDRELCRRAGDLLDRAGRTAESEHLDEGWALPVLWIDLPAPVRPATATALGIIAEWQAALPPLCGYCCGRGLRVTVDFCSLGHESDWVEGVAS